jgi:ferredoxin-NADP reductase
MKPFTVKIKSIQHITHDVLLIVTEKPIHFNFIPGQATEISINKEGWQDKKRPFTFTSLPDNNFLEFTIKTYPQNKEVTNEMLALKVGEELILHDIFGAIAYKGEGVFIAGGAGVTPFISIFRDLKSKKEVGSNQLIFANKTKKDIIQEVEFEKILGKNFINILSDEKVDGYANGQITEDFLKTYICESTKNIYICGPPPMMDAIEKQLLHLKIDKKQIIKEAF